MVVGGVQRAIAIGHDKLLPYSLPYHSLNEILPQRGEHELDLIRVRVRARARAGARVGVRARARARARVGVGVRVGVRVEVGVRVRVRASSTASRTVGVVGSRSGWSPCIAPRGGVPGSRPGLTWSGSGLGLWLGSGLGLEL